MKHNWFQRILSALLACVLVLGYFPVTVLAEETTAAEEIVENTIETVPETTMETEPETTEEPEPETEPETEPIVQPETEPVTEPATEPETVPETIPDTAPVTEPELLIEPEAVQTQDSTGTVIASGPCGADGDNVTYVLTDDGTLTISGSGRMMDYDLDSLAPWYDKYSQIKTVAIEQGVTSISNYAIWYCYRLTSVTIPDSVTSIGDRRSLIAKHSPA